MENTEDTKRRLINLTSLCVEYCATCEGASEMEQGEFTDRMLGLLPRIYLEFLDIAPEEMVMLEEYGVYADYVDEDYYENVRRHIETVMGPEDTFLETFEADMKYSDTPIAASISESLADIFQPLYNFVSVVKDTEGEQIVEAYLQCREDFEGYWSQTLCNVLRALNNVRFKIAN